MRLVVKESYGDVCDFVAKRVAEAISAHKEKRPFVLGLPTGSTPLGVYERLVAMHKAGKLSFRNVVTFNMDEYVGLPAEHPESYHSFMFANLFSHIDVPRENINILDGNAPDLQAECARYEEKLKAFGCADLFLGGVGVDGHIAFNEPGSAFDSVTRIVRLEQNTREVNSRFFGNDPSAVPESALTIGIGTLLSSREIIVMATGAAKANAVRDAVNGEISESCPCSALRRHADATLLCDKAAAGGVGAGS